MKLYLVAVATSFIFNNHVLGMVRQWQDLFYGKRYSATVLDDQVDFVKVSEGMGAKAYSVETIEEFERAFKEAIELNIPCVIDCHIDREDKYSLWFHRGLQSQRHSTEKTLITRNNSYIDFNVIKD